MIGICFRKKIADSLVISQNLTNINNKPFSNGKKGEVNEWEHGN